MTDGILRSITRGSTVTHAPYPMPVEVVVPLLDDFPNALVACSFRKLRTAYAGSAARIRRSSDNAEADIGFDVDGNFDTAAAATHIGGGTGFVTKLYDQSGNGDDMVNTTAAQQPTYNATKINSKPGAVCSAEPMWLSTSGAADVTLGGTVLSGFAVFIFDFLLGTSERIFNYIANGDGDDYSAATSGLMMYAASTTTIGGYRGGGAKSTKGTVTTGVGYSGAGIFDGTNHTAYLNGSAGTPVGSTGTFGAAGRIAAGYHQGGGGQLKGAFSEVVCYAADQTSIVSGVHSNQSAYWGV